MQSKRYNSFENFPGYLPHQFGSSINPSVSLFFGRLGIDARILYFAGFQGMKDKNAEPCHICAPMVKSPAGARWKTILDGETEAPFTVDSKIHDQSTLHTASVCSCSSSAGAIRAWISATAPAACNSIPRPSSSSRTNLVRLLLADLTLPFAIKSRGCVC